MSYLIESAASVFQCVLCLDFIIKFNGSTWKKSKLSIPTLLLLCAWLLICDKVFPAFSSLSMIVLVVVSILFAFTICKGHYVRAFVSSCLVYTIVITVSSLSFTVLAFFIKDINVLLYGATDTVRYIYLVLGNACVFAIVRLTLHIFRFNQRVDLKNGLLTFLFTLISILGMGATMHIALLTQNMSLDIQILLISSSFILCNVILYLLVNQVQRLQKHQYEIKLLTEKMAFEKSQYEEATELWEGARLLRHDTRQHYSVILGLLETGEHEKCMDYVRDLFPALEKGDHRFKTDHPILDYIINAKLAKVTDVDIVLLGSVDRLDLIEDGDLSSMLGNMLDNALEALEKLDGSKEKRLELLFAMYNSNRVIICKNTINESVLKTNKKLRSTKPDPESHGLGHKVVEKIVSKYSGTVSYFEENGMFGVQLVIPIQRR